MAMDKAAPPSFPHPHTFTQATTTRNTQPKNPASFGTCTCNYLQSVGPIMTTAKPATPGPSTAITLRGFRHKTTTIANQPATTAAQQSLSQSIRFFWTTQEVTELVQLRSHGLSWSRVSTHFPGKTKNACRKRHERYKKSIQASVIEESNGRGLIATPVELMATYPLRVSGRESTSSTTATALTSSQARMFASIDWTTE